MADVGETGMGLGNGLSSSIDGDRGVARVAVDELVFEFELVEFIQNGRMGAVCPDAVPTNPADLSGKERPGIGDTELEAPFMTCGRAMLQEYYVSDDNHSNEKGVHLTGLIAGCTPLR